MSTHRERGRKKGDTQYKGQHYTASSLMLMLLMWSSSLSLGPVNDQFDPERFARACVLYVYTHESHIERGGKGKGSGHITYGWKEEEQDLVL